MKLQLYSVNDRYAFAVGKFSSLSHFWLCPDIKPTYKYAWEAYRDAHRLFQHQRIHIDVMEKIAGDASIDDLSSSADDLAVSDMASTQEVSAEQMIIGHYSTIFAAIENKCKSFKDEKDKELAYKEVKGIVGGLLKVKESLEKGEDKSKIEKVLDDFRRLVHEKFPKLLAKDKEEMEREKKNPKAPPAPPVPPNAEGGEMPPDMGQQGQQGAAPELPMMPMAQVDAILKYGSNMLGDIRTEMLDEYAERVCRCIEKHHPNAICKIDYDGGVFNISSATEGSLLRVAVNDDLQLQDIEPYAGLSSAFPIHSLEFYQKYWKPIVERVGHCLSRDLGIMICPSKSTLPDIPNEFPYSVKVSGWSVKDQAERPFEVCFSGENPTWMLRSVDFIKEAATAKPKPSRFTEEDFIRGQPRRVQCIDENLQSIYGKIGEVVQVIPLQDHIEVDVDFGRLVVRLTESQIKLIDEIPNNTQEAGR